MEPIPKIPRRMTRNAADLLNNMRQQVEALSRAGTGAAPGEMIPEAAPDLPIIVARITGKTIPSLGPIPYSYQIVTINDVAEFGDVQSNRAEWSDFPAYEKSGNNLVPVDGSAIVVLEYGPDGSWFFDWSDTTVYALLGSESGGKYAWEEVYPISDGDFATLPDGRSGTTSLNFATARDGSLDMSGEYVVLTRAYCTGYANVRSDILVPGNADTRTQCQQSLIIDNAMGGTFTLTLDMGDPTDPDYVSDPVTTNPINFDVDAAELSLALQSFGSPTVTGTGNAADPFIINFVGTNVPFLLMDSDSSELESDQEWSFDGGSGGGGNVLWVKVTSLTPVSGHLPGELFDKDLNDTGLAVWADPAQDTPVVGRFYMARRGTDADGRQVWRLDPFSGITFDTYTTSTGPFLTDYSIDPTTCVPTKTYKTLTLTAVLVTGSSISLGLA